MKSFLFCCTWYYNLPAPHGLNQLQRRYTNARQQRFGENNTGGGSKRHEWGQISRSAFPGKDKSPANAVFARLLAPGAEGLEPSTFGFGDQRSTDWTIPLKSSPSRARTYDPSVNSRLLYHWAIEDYFYSGSHLLSRAVPRQVSSAVYVLTIVFGMGTGVSHKRIATANFYIQFKYFS